MNKKQKITIGVLGGLFIVSLITMIVVLVAANAKPPFVPPEFEVNAIIGMPDANKVEGYSILGQDDLGFKVGFCGKPELKDGKTYVYFANVKENNVWLKLRALDKDDNKIYDTGIIKPGQYIEYIELGENIKANDEITFKVMAYQPDTYYSEGAVLLNTVIS